MTVTESLPSDVQPVARTTLMLTMVSGVCALIIGILILVWPETTLLVVAILFGIQLLVSGVMRIIGGAVDSSAEGWKRGLLITLGVLIALAGIFCLRNPALSLLTIILVVAVGWLVAGILTLVLGFSESARRTGGTYPAGGRLSSWGNRPARLSNVGLAHVCSAWWLDPDRLRHRHTHRRDSRIAEVAESRLTFLVVGGSPVVG